MSMSASPPLLKESEVAKTLCISLAAVRRWRTEGKGPQYLKLGTLVRYRSQDLAEWLRSRPSGGERRVLGSGIGNPRHREE
jgi:predicted DNA-binding transcriptional regulator AlpA